MSEIITTNTQLPSTLEDLSRFVLIGREKLNSVRAEIRAIENIELAVEVREQKLQEAQELGNALLDAEARIGILTSQIEKASGGDHGNQYTSGKNTGGSNFGTGDEEADDALAKTEKLKSKTKKEKARELGFSMNQISEFQRMAKNQDLIEEVKAEAVTEKRVPTRQDVIKKIKNQEKKQEVREAEKKIQSEVTEKYQAHLTVGDGIGYVPPEEYDLLFTDPPYSTDVDNIEQFVDDWLYNALSYVKDTGFAYIFIGAYPEEAKAYLNAKLPSHINLEQMLVWTYKNTLGNNPKDRYKLNYQFCLFYRGVNAPNLNCPITNEQWAVQEINAPDGRQGDRYHAWQKPMEIAERFIRHSTTQDMTVFDPFACTGTFLLAAAKLGRKSYGFEINPEHAKIAFERGCLRG